MRKIIAIIYLHRQILNEIFDFLGKHNLKPAHIGEIDNIISCNSK